MKLADISLGMPIFFAGIPDGGGRFRTIGVVTGILTQKEVKGEVYVQNLSNFRYYTVEFDPAGNAVKPPEGWESDLDSPALASDDEVRDLVDMILKQKDLDRQPSRYVHPATVMCLDRIGRRNYIAD